VGAYRTVVVGTDGSDTSLRAVARAGALAGAAGATPVVVTAYLPTDEDDRDLARARDTLGDEAYRITGSMNADLLVVGNRGLDSGKGRLLGSVPADATRRSEVDVLVVHTTG
jgi:nucleotide-binding universal stress UspA family protein